EQFKGNALVYLPKYLPANDPAFQASDEELRSIFLSGLAKMYPNFDRADVLAFQVSRVRNVFAIPTVGYSLKVPSIDTSVAGLHIGRSSQIVNGILNVNETVQLAERALIELQDAPVRKDELEPAVV